MKNMKKNLTFFRTLRLAVLSVLSLLAMSATTAWAGETFGESATFEVDLRVGNSAPELSGLVASVSADGEQVAFRYELSDADGDPCDVSLEFSYEGSDWIQAPPGISGSVGPGVFPGRRDFRWDWPVSHASQRWREIRVRILVDDRVNPVETAEFPVFDIGKIGLQISPDAQTSNILRANFVLSGNPGRPLAYKVWMIHYGYQITKELGVPLFWGDTEDLYANNTYYFQWSYPGELAPFQTHNVGLVFELQDEFESLVFTQNVALAVTEFGNRDDDGDGVPNDTDQCPGTVFGPVNLNGCPLEEDQAQEAIQRVVLLFGETVPFRLAYDRVFSSYIDVAGELPGWSPQDPEALRKAVEDYFREVDVDNLVVEIGTTPKERAKNIYFAQLSPGDWVKPNSESVLGLAISSINPQNWQKYGLAVVGVGHTGDMDSLQNQAYVTAHEIGHLLGLVHVVGTGALMEAAIGGTRISTNVLPLAANLHTCSDCNTAYNLRKFVDREEDIPLQEGSFDSCPPETLRLYFPGFGLSGARVDEGSTIIYEFELFESTDSHHIHRVAYYPAIRLSELASLGLNVVQGCSVFARGYSQPGASGAPDYYFAVRPPQTSEDYTFTASEETNGEALSLYQVTSSSTNLIATGQIGMEANEVQDAVLAWEQDGGQPTATWFARAGREYQLQRAAFPDGPYEDVPGLTGAGINQLVEMELGAFPEGTNFFRLRGTNPMMVVEPVGEPLSRP